MYRESGEEYSFRNQLQGHNTAPSKAWLGPDIPVRGSRRIDPGETVALPLDVARIKDDVPFSAIRGLVVNGRSRYAQLGGDLSLRAGFLVAQALALPKAPETVAVPLTNHSHAPLEIEEGPIGRLLNPHSAHVTGDRLDELIASGEIFVDGLEHEDWWRHTGKDGETIGLGMLLQPERWIPERTEPVEVPPSARGNFREILDTALEPINPNDTPRIRIGETIATLGLSERVLGRIDARVDLSQAPSDVRIGNRDHINATWLYGGDKWNIRTELLSSKLERAFPDKKLPPKAVIFTFATVRNT